MNTLLSSNDSPGAQRNGTEMRLAVPDLISPSYFPAIAAVELGLMREEGVDVSLELRFPVTDAARALRDDEIDFLAGAAHAPLYAATKWGETKIVAALSRNMYWFLVAGAASGLQRGELSRMRDMRVGAAPGPDLGLRQALLRAGVDIDGANLEIAPVQSTDKSNVSFGVAAAEALAEGRIDAFWANGMGAEIAVTNGVGKVILDARRDGGMSAGFTFPALMTTRRLIAERAEEVAAAVRGIARVHRALRDDPGLAEKVGSRLFPAMEATLIERLVRRDLPFYKAAISDSAITDVNDFACSSGLLAAPAAYDDVVATQFVDFWDA